MQNLTTTCNKTVTNINITCAQAAHIVNALNSTVNSAINLNSVYNAFSTINTVANAIITQASPVTLARNFKHLSIYKVNLLSVTVCNNNSNLYNSAVTQHVINTQQASAFNALASNYNAVNNMYSLVTLKSNANNVYIRAIVNKHLASAYYCATTNTLLTKQQLAQYLTNSAATKLLNNNSTTTVKHANITHNVIVRNFALANIYSLTVNNSKLTVC